MQEQEATHNELIKLNKRIAKGTFKALPRVGGLRQNVSDLEVAMLLGQRVDLFLQEDVFLSAIGENQRNGGFIRRVFKDLSDHLSSIHYDYSGPCTQR